MYQYMGHKWRPTYVFCLFVCFWESIAGPSVNSTELVKTNGGRSMFSLEHAELKAVLKIFNAVL